MAVYDPGDPRYPELPPNGMPGSSPAPAPAPQPDIRSGIAAAYQKYLGRSPSESDYMSWTGNNNYEAGISGSPEAAAYAKGQNYTPQYNQMAGYDSGKLNDPNKHDPKYDWGRVVQQHPDWLKVGGLDQLVAFYNSSFGGKAKVTGADSVDFGDGYGPVDVIQASHTTNPQPWWYPQSAMGGGTTTAPGGAAGAGATGTGMPGGGSPGITATGTGGGPAGAAGNSVFSDPATQEWEAMLRTLIDKLNQPVPNLTPGQMELQQTQALDPMTRERDAQKQRAIQYYAARGQEPGHSGIVDQALADIDKQFEQNRTTTQANFAVNDINRQDQTRQTNLNNATNAVSQFKQIPQLADQRLATAQGIVGGGTPSAVQLLQLQQSIAQQQQQQSYLQSNQQQNFWTQMAAILADAFT